MHIDVDTLQQAELNACIRHTVLGHLRHTNTTSGVAKDPIARRKAAVLTTSRKAAVLHFRGLYPSVQT